MHSRSLRPIRWIASGALSLVFAIGACTNSDSPTSQQSNHSQAPLLSKAQAESLGQVVALDADAMIEGTSFNGAAAIPFGVAGAPTASPALLTGCLPAISPLPVVNSDSDMVPDSLRIDFTGCSFSTRRGTVSLAGTIDFIDPTPAATDHAIKTVFTGLAQTLTNSAGDTLRQFTEDGSRELIGTSSQFQFTESNFKTTWKSGDDAAEHDKNWSATFTADTAGSITSFRLPSGTWDINGSSTFIRADSSAADTLSLTVSTGPGLHFNRTCTESPRFDSGTLTAVVTKNSQTATVTITFTACGQFTVTKT